MTIVSGAHSCGIIYDDHSDDSIGVIYAPRVTYYASVEHIVQV
jgi:hypothetical protein